MECLSNLEGRLSKSLGGSRGVQSRSIYVDAITASDAKRG
jgi:hypothetical protein